MNADQFHRRWAKRHEELLADTLKWIERARNRGDVEDIHLLRVTLRRLRLVARLGTPILSLRRVRELRDWAGRVSDRAGLVRDLDMALEHVPTSPRTKDLRQAIGRRRRRVWKSTKSFYRLPSRKLFKSLLASDASAKQRARLAHGFSLEAAEHFAEVMADAPRFFDLEPLDQHAFRRALRRLRYLREVDVPPKDWANDIALKRLIGLQGAIGELQNRLIAIEILDSFSNTDMTVAIQDRLRSECDTWRAAIRRSLRPFLPRAKSPFTLCRPAVDTPESGR